MNRGERNSFEMQVKCGDLGVEAAVKASQDIGRRAVEIEKMVQSGALGLKDLLKRDPVYRPLIAMLEKKQIV